MVHDEPNTIIRLPSDLHLSYLDHLIMTGWSIGFKMQYIQIDIHLVGVMLCFHMVLQRLILEIYTHGASVLFVLWSYQEFL